MSELIEVKVSDLCGEALNWAVGKADGQPVYVEDPHYGNPSRVLVRGKRPGCFLAEHRRFNPVVDWSVTGPLIEKHLVDLHYPHGLPGRGWWAQAGTHSQESPLAAMDATPLIASCRAIVASVLGPVVSVPKELCHE
ncbi:hypothetical protein M2401_000830 [Pseudomonas sp. JUb42]|uniref:DUF2591 domain-containing protein n=1 Tax=Pseudomonas sp. JUb42 TaxID=2940611 RepID=UPI00216A2AB6|nr:DUF2591 domain-containing protein [Pseudomonas sp. JUb42]MCS3467109.1 hypothetical protein [Pseudomonas sp. JUb42]